jgi:hypothetical protein
MFDCPHGARVFGQLVLQVAARLVDFLEAPLQVHALLVDAAFVGDQPLAESHQLVLRVAPQLAEVFSINR